MNDIMYNWEACISCGFKKRRMIEVWSPPVTSLLKFNVDGSAKGKLGHAGVVRKDKGDVL